MAWREGSNALIVLGAKFESRKYAKYARDMANLAESHSLLASHVLRMRHKCSGVTAVCLSLGEAHSVGDSFHHLLNPMRIQHLGDVRPGPPSIHGSDGCQVIVDGCRAVVIGKEEFQERPHVV